MRSPIVNLLLLIPLIVGSWILIHLLAFFGIFLGIAYPMWWFIAPSQTVCLMCRSAREGSWCRLCRRPIIKIDGMAPASFSSALLNGVVIIVFSLISSGLVFGESTLLYKFGFPPTPKTASFIIPTKGQYKLGELFPMKIEIDNLKGSINAVQADIGYDPTKVQAQEISTNGSFANIFIQKEINNEGGWARLTGGLPNPGFYGNHGTFGTIYFKGTSPGIVRIRFLDSSMVLANDGRGTNILKEFPEVSYLILPEKLSAEEEKMQDSLLKNNVLGASTGVSQMNFYGDTGIVGAVIPPVKEENKDGPGALNSFLGGLEKIDNFILGGWTKVLSGGSK